MPPLKVFQKRLVLAVPVLGVALSLMAWFVSPAWARVWIGLLVALLLLLGVGVGAWFMLCWAGRRSPLLPLIATGLLVATGLALFATFWINQKIFAYAKQDALDYPQKIEPFLADYFRSHGRYPESLRELPTVPRLLQYARRSEGKESAFEFAFTDPECIWDEWRYSSGEHAWNVFN